MDTHKNDGRDELNLAEFPLCALTHRLRPDQKTIRFEDRVWDWDEQRGTTTTRQLTITGSDAYGLPTAHSTRLRAFRSRPSSGMKSSAVFRPVISRALILISSNHSTAPSPNAFTVSSPNASFTSGAGIST